MFKVKPIKTNNLAPCFSCSMNFNKDGLKCFEFCDKLRFWCEIQDAKRAHIEKQEAALAAPRKPCERKLREMEEEVDQEVKEFIEAVHQIPERDELSQEEIEAMADEILADLEKEENR